VYLSVWKIGPCVTQDAVSKGRTPIRGTITKHRKYFSGINSMIPRRTVSVSRVPLTLLRSISDGKAVNRIYIYILYIDHNPNVYWI